MSKKSSLFVRLISAMLASVMLICTLPALSLGVAAVEDYTHAERYMTDKFSSDGCKINTAAEYTTVEITDSGASIYGDVDISNDVKELNAIKINLQNNSSCDRIIFEYTCIDRTGLPLSREIAVDIQANTKRQDYYIFLDLSDGIISYKLNFESVHSGRIRIYSVNAVSVYDNTLEGELGVISECVFDPASASVNVRGTVKYDATVNYKDGRLGLFALGTEDTLASVGANLERQPLLEVPMSNRFNFRVNVSGFGDRASRYAVFIIYLDENSETVRIPLAQARYAEGVASQIAPSYKTGAFKGVNTMYFSSAMDSYAASAVVDVYLNSLVNTANASVAHSVFGYNVYFDRSYLEYIDLAVKNYSAMGSKVYLRFLISSGNDGLPFTVSDGVERKYKGILLDSEEASMCLYGVADFLGARYSADGDKTVDGIIIGSRIDRADSFNYVGRKTLKDYAQNYARTLSVFSIAWRTYNPSVELVVPLSDAVCDEVAVLDESFKAYTQDILMSGICKYFSASLANYNQIRLMVESDATPCALNADGLLSPSETDGDTLSVNDIKSFENMIKDVEAGDCLDKEFIYYWNVGADTVGTQLAGSYVYSYFTLFNERNVSEFIVSFAESEINGGSDRFFQIKNIFKYIDTQLASDVTEPVRKHFGVDSWKQLVSKYGEKSTIRISALQSELLDEPKGNIKGEFEYWDFALATGSLGWYGGVNCSSIAVSSSGGFRALVGNMSVGHGDEYGSVIYEFPYTEDISIGDYLSFDVFISDEVGASYELKLTLGGENYTAESRCIATASADTTRLYFDTSILNQFGNVKYLRLSARSLSGASDTYSLGLSEVILHSTSQSSDELEEAVLRSRRELREAQTEEQKGSALPTKYVIVIFAGVLFMSVITIMVARKKDFFER